MPTSFEPTPSETTSSNDKTNFTWYIEEEKLLEELFQYFYKLRSMLENKIQNENEEKTRVIIETNKDLGSSSGVIVNFPTDRTCDRPLFLTTSSTERLCNYYNHLVETCKERLSHSISNPGCTIDLLETAKRHLYRFYLDEVCKLYKDSNPQLAYELQLQAKLFDSPDLVDNKHATISIQDWRFRNMIPEQEYNLPNPECDTIISCPIQEGAFHRTASTIVKIQQSNSFWRRILYYLSLIFPIIAWLPEYCKRSEMLKNIKRDILAGVTIAIILCPQGIGYALVAGMPPIYGLYTAFVPGLIYPWLGTSRVLAVGPSVIISLIIYQSMHTQVNPRTTDEYVNWVLLISMIFGAIQLLLGILRLGFLINFISKPVLSGFTSGSAILIIMTQLKSLFGVHLASEVNPQIYWSLYYYGKAIFTPTFTGKDNGVNWPTILCAGICFFFLITLKYVPIPFRGRKIYIDNYFPSNLIVIIFGTILMTLISLTPNSQGSYDVFGIKVLGHLETGLPVPKLPQFYSSYKLVNSSKPGDALVYIPVGKPSIPMDVLGKACILALPCVLIGFSEAYSVGSLYAVRDNYQVDANQELISIGLSAFVGSFFSAYTASTSFSRSALNAQTGVRSQLAGLLTAILMIPILQWIMPLFYYLPKALLGSMIIMAVIKLIDIRILKFMWITKKRDFFLCLICFLCTLFVGIVWGVIIAVILSLILVIYRASRPRVLTLGREPGTMNYVNIRSSTQTINIPGVLVLRFDGEMFFGNATYLFRKIRKRIEQSKNEEVVSDISRLTNRMRALVLDMAAVNQIDTTSVWNLQDIKKTLDYNGIAWYMTGTKPEIMKVMRRSGFLDKIFPEEHFFSNIHDAVRYAIEALKQQEKEEMTRKVVTVTIQATEHREDMIQAVSKGSRKTTKM